MNLNLIYSIVGLLGGLICCVADILLDLKGKDNKTIGHVHSSWDRMSLWRFHWSIILGAISIPMYNLGIISLGNQVEGASHTVGYILRLLGYLSNAYAIFIHTSICLGPCVYKAIGDEVYGAKAVEGLLKACEKPFIVFYLVEIFGISGTVAYAIIRNYIQLSNFFILLTPLVTFVFGMTLRKIKYDWFYDLPGIIMPSFGIACIGLIGILNIVLNKDIPIKKTN